MPHPTSRYEPPRTLREHARQHPFAARILGVVAVSALLVPVARTFDRNDTQVVRTTGLENAAMLPAAVVPGRSAGAGASAASGGAGAAPASAAGADEGGSTETADAGTDAAPATGSSSTEGTTSASTGARARSGSESVGTSGGPGTSATTAARPATSARPKATTATTAATPVTTSAKPKTTTASTAAKPAAAPPAQATVPPTTAKPAPTTAAPKATTPATTAPPTTTTTSDAPPPNRWTRAQAEAIIRQYWPPDLADQAVAVATRESNLIPTVRNWCCYGLFQINFNGNKATLAALGITSPAALYDPAINAQAAVVLYQRSGWSPWN